MLCDPLPQSRFTELSGMKLRTRSRSAHTHTTASQVACLYAGISMEPTLHAADVLEIIPYDNRPIRAGDVIFFLPSESEQRIDHRVF